MGAELGADPIAVWVGILVLYVVWGSTYLGMKVAMDTLPVFVMGVFRFVPHYQFEGMDVSLGAAYENAIAKNREIMGATDPAKAAPGTIRKDCGKDVEQNAVHGSDGPETAASEIAFFFRPDEIV